MDIKTAIEKLNKIWSDSFNKKDIQGCLSIYDEDAQILPPNVPIISGSKALMHFIENWIECSGGNFKNHLINFGIDGNLVYEVASYHIECGQLSDTGKLIHLIRRKKDDSLKVFLTMFNSNLPSLVK